MVLAQKIGFIGAGQMARALAVGMLRAGLVEGSALLASDPEPAALADFGRQVAGAKTFRENGPVASEADVVILAVKPQHMDQVLEELNGVLKAGKLVVSIAAGVRISHMAAGLAEGVRIVRVMPSTPCLVGRGVSAYCLGPDVGNAEGDLVAKLLSSVGVTIELEEKLLDAVTGLSGSGPAFVCVVIEALSDGGVQMGLPRAIASLMAIETVRGTAELLLARQEHPAALKDRVASPGGTTIAGLAALEQHGLRGALIAAVEAATRRSIQLGQEGQGKEK